jgi:hypothetical protein
MPIDLRSNTSVISDVYYKETSGFCQTFKHTHTHTHTHHHHHHHHHHHLEFSSFSHNSTKSDIDLPQTTRPHATYTWVCLDASRSWGERCEPCLQGYWSPQSQSTWFSGTKVQVLTQNLEVIYFDSQGYSSWFTFLVNLPECIRGGC